MSRNSTKNTPKTPLKQAQTIPKHPETNRNTPEHLNR